MDDTFIRYWSLKGVAFCMIKVAIPLSSTDLEFLQLCFDRTLEELKEKETYNGSTCKEASEESADSRQG